MSWSRAGGGEQVLKALTADFLLILAVLEQGAQRCVDSLLGELGLAQQMHGCPNHEQCSN